MKLVIVDIQPEYESNTTFDIGDMLRKAAEDYSQVLVLFNGEDTLGMISEGELKNFYLEKLDYDEDVFDELLSKSTFFDKGYGFFRDVMDSDVCFNRASIIKIVKYMIDDAPAKIGCYTPGSHLEIVSRSILNSKNAPDYVLVFAWSFFEEIVKRNNNFIKSGGKMIVPLPEVKVISF